LTPPPDEGPHRPTVAVCICTYRRPAVLGGLLDRLAEVAADAADIARVGVVVVDDDAGRSAEPVVDGRVFEGGVTYVATGSGNIATARNRALAEGVAAADLLALIDDDCLPHVDWVRQLVLARERFDADIVTGYCIDLPPAGAPRWYVDEPWVRPSPPLPDGTAVDAGGVKNALVTSEAVRRLDLGFDEAFGPLGGEDVLFFYRAAAKGATHRYAAAAVVEEEVPLPRTTLRYQLRRALWYGNSEAVTQITAGRQGRLRMVASGAKRLAAGPAHVLGQLRRRRPTEWRWGLALSLMGCGRIAGALGARLRHSAVNASARSSAAA
jgi:succinoglycan biosynthesis protein ExoM